MLKIILEIISISCGAFIFAQASGFMQWIKQQTGQERIKPFDCTLCLSFWISLIYCVINLEENIFIYVTICPVLGYYIENKL